MYDAKLIAEERSMLQSSAETRIFTFELHFMTLRANKGETSSLCNLLIEMTRTSLLL